MNKFYQLCILIICLVYPAYLSDDVIDLSLNDISGFQAELKKFDTALVEFFAPWCGHCKKLAPEYSKAATILQSHDPPVPLAKVDCTSDSGKDICQEFGVSGYPTLKIFKSGEFSSDYNGPREADGIVKYMKAQVGPSSRAYGSFQSLNDKLKQSKEVVVLGLFSSQSDNLASKFHKVADKLRESVSFAHIYSSAVSDDLSSLTSLSGKTVSAPAVILIRPPILSNKFEESLVIYDESKPLDQWIPTNYHGLVGHRTQSNMQDFNLPLVIVYYDVDYVKNPKGTNYWRNRVLKVAQNYPDMYFAISNSELFAAEMEGFGLEPDKTGRDALPLVALKASDDKKYVLTEKFSVSSLESFIKNFIDGKLEPYLKSEDVPADNSGPVKVAVAKNFEELVIKSPKDIFIEFYAPWCGHCKKLAPTWEELGTLLKNEPNIDIVKMDATANDVPSPFVVHGFPTIYWYPSESKEPSKYEGGRELQDLLDYVSKHSTKELVEYNRDGKKKKQEL